jgi:hypothetical protein
MGAEMPLQQLAEDQRRADLSAAIAYGNHKSAKSNGEIALATLQDEVTRGWQLPLPVPSLDSIPGVVVSPVGMTDQRTIDENGRIVQKWRLTHDQSFSFDSGFSVNARVIEEKLDPCLYGWVLKRLAHAICFYRNKFPGTPILGAKFDLKSAYRRVHAASSTAIQSVVTTQGLGAQTDLALVSLRMTFGGKANPSEFSTISECMTWLIFYCNAPIGSPANSIHRIQHCSATMNSSPTAYLSHRHDHC